MAITTQMKLLRAVQEMLMGNGTDALPRGNSPKPDFINSNQSLPLPRSTPEAEGLPSHAIEKLYRNLAAMPRANLHSLLVLRHGKVVSEGYFSPYRSNVWHVTHSLCKTITGAAVGLAIDEGLFSLEDPVLDYFPKEAGFFPSKHLRAITVRHLLSMCSGISFNEIGEAVETDWIKGIFTSPVTFEPGCRFVYNSMNSYLLAALVCKTSGQTLTDFLTPRLFAPMGFGPFGWELSPQGVEKGGWGCYMMVEDMAKFGQLYLQGGRWDGRQLLPEEWVKQTISSHIQSDLEAFGYGFQCWVDKDNGFVTMNGMFGQYVILVPEKQLVVVTTGGNPCLMPESPVYREIVAFINSLGQMKSSLPPAPAATARLKRMASGLNFRRAVPAIIQSLQTRRAGALRGWRLPQRPTQEGRISDEEALNEFLGKTWSFGRNKGGLLPVIVQAMNNNFTTGVKAVHFEKAEDGSLLLLWEEGRGTAALPLGLNQHLERRIFVGKESFIVAGGARLAYDEDQNPVLVVELCFLEHSSFRLLKFSLEGDELLLRMDEQPRFKSAIEGAATQTESTQGGQGAKSGSLTSLVMDNDFINFRLAQLCAPTLKGTLFEPDSTDVVKL